MAFVNEAVPEEQKSKFDPKVFFDPNSSFRLPSVIYKWVIDHERDVFLVRLGGGGPWEGPHAPKPEESLALCWKGEVVKFEATYDEEGRFLDGNLVGTWEVLNVHLPQTLEAQRDTVLQLIKEGLEATGDDCFNNARLTALNIHFKNHAVK